MGPALEPFGVAQLVDPTASGLTADVVIVGSGAGAAAVGGELARAGLDVLLVEAGGALDSSRPGAHIQNTFPAEEQLETHYGPQVWGDLVPFAHAKNRFTAMRGALSIHSVGGMLSYWSHMCPVPDFETEGEPAVPAAEMQMLWQRALELLWADTSIEARGVRQARVLAAVRAGFPALPAGREVQQLAVAMRRNSQGQIEYAGADALLAPSPTGKTVRILEGHPVRSIVLRGSRAVGLVAGNGRHEVTVSAGAVVVAAGAVGTPQLLHASGVRPAALGRYLVDHTQLVSRVKLRDDLLQGVPTDDVPFSVWIPASSAREMHTQISRGWITSSPILAGIDSRRTADIGQFTGVDPNPDNRLAFSDQVEDGFGLPAVDVEFELSRADRDRAARMFADHYRVAETIADFGYALEASFMPPGTSLHLMGTHRMGALDDGTSVADSFGKVWGVDDLFVAGNGLISTRNSGNPTVNSVALALRVAQGVVQRPAVVRAAQ